MQGQTALNASIQTLSAQRNQAMDIIAQQAGTIAVLQKENEDLKKQLEEAATPKG